MPAEHVYVLSMTPLMTAEDSAPLSTPATSVA